jgi:hypothetical protein
VFDQRDVYANLVRIEHQIGGICEVSGDKMKIDGIIWLRDVVDKLALIYKRTKEILILSAREMARKERRQYDKN